MSDAKRPGTGTIAWTDLTIANADAVRDFYREVVGWQASAVDMGGYSDYNMLATSTGEPVAGICHARGGNADLPPQWLVYIIVEDVDDCARKCVERGGGVLSGPRGLAGGRFCVIQDPAGAVCALYQPAAGAR